MKTTPVITLPKGPQPKDFSFPVESINVGGVEIHNAEVHVQEVGDNKLSVTITTDWSADDLQHFMNYYEAWKSACMPY